MQAANARPSRAVQKFHQRPENINRGAFVISGVGRLSATIGRGSGIKGCMVAGGYTKSGICVKNLGENFIQTA